MMKNTKRLSIFQVEPLGRGGIAHYTFFLASALKEKGMLVTLLTANQYELGEEACFEVSEIFKLRGYSNLFPRPIRQFLKALAVIHGTYFLRKHIRSKSPDVLHFQGSVPLADWLFSRFTWRYARKRDIKIIYTAHDILPHEQKLALHKFIYRFIYKKADALIIHSNNSRKALEKIVPDHQPAHIIPLGDWSFFNQKDTADKNVAKTNLGLDPDDKVILFFGAIRPYKGLDTLIKACALVHRRGYDFKLLIVGNLLENFAKYENLIEKANVADRVIRVLEYVPNDQIALYFNAANVLVLPYKKTYQSAVVQLAFAFGIPTICSNTGGLADVVNDGQNGFLFEPDDENSLAELMIKVLSDKSLAKRLGDNGKHNATNSSWSVIADTTLETYGFGDYETREIILSMQVIDKNA